MQHGLDLQTVICLDCSFVFTNPMPPAETYERFNAEAYSSYYTDTQTPLTCKTVSEQPDDIRWKLDQIEAVTTLSGKRFVEIGSGHGLLLWWARQRGCNVLAIEPGREGCAMLRRIDVPCCHRLLPQVTRADVGDVDILVMSHVLQRFHDPNEALANCRRLLPRGCLLVVDVPNILKPCGSLDRHYFRYVHPSCFSPDTLRAFLERHAFCVHVLKETGVNVDGSAGLLAIASKEKESSLTRFIPVQTAQDVLHTLCTYRRRWKCGLAFPWLLRQMGRRLRSVVTRETKPKIHPRDNYEKQGEACIHH